MTNSSKSSNSSTAALAEAVRHNREQVLGLSECYTLGDQCDACQEAIDTLLASQHALTMANAREAVDAMSSWNLALDKRNVLAALDALKVQP